jgi:hypothetical protein
VHFVFTFLSLALFIVHSAVQTLPWTVVRDCQTSWHEIMIQCIFVLQHKTFAAVCCEIKRMAHCTNKCLFSRLDFRFPFPLYIWIIEPIIEPANGRLLCPNLEWHMHTIKFRIGSFRRLLKYFPLVNERKMLNLSRMQARERQTHK